MNRSTIIHPFSVALVMLAAALGSGCQMWRIEPSMLGDVAATEKLDAVRVALKVDGWHSNHAWNPQDEWQHRHENLPTPKRMRYTYALAKAGEQKKPEASRGPKTESPQPASRQSQNKTVLTSPRGRQNSLSGLVKQDSPVIRAQSPAEMPASKVATLPQVNKSATNPATEKNQSSATKSDPAKTPPPTASEASQVKTLQEQAPAAEKAGDRETSSNTAWDGFWPLGIERLIETTASEIDSSATQDLKGPQAALERCLSSLARGDDLAGWNAAILWARHHPAEAVGAALVLERLVTDPPYYDSQNGQRVFPNALPAGPASTAPDGQQKQHPQTKDAVSNASSTMVATWQKLTGVEEAELKTASASPSKPLQISRSMRLAAAEAWCLLLALSEPDAEDGLGPAGLLLERTDLPVEVRGELFRGVARWIAPASIPRLENALREGDDQERAPIEMRRAAIESCLIYALWSPLHDNASSVAISASGASTKEPQTGEPASKTSTSPVQATVSKHLSPLAVHEFDPDEWPVTCDFCRTDPDPPVRWTYGKWLSVTKAPQVLEVLKSQLQDVDLRVRNEALGSLASLGGEEARAELKAQAERTRDRTRAAAVHGLSRWGIQEISPYVRDESYFVRAAVAGDLGHSPCVESAVLLQELLIDSNADVQQDALAAIDGWSDPLAIPLLLHGMRDSSARTRKDCHRALEKRRKIDTPYHYDASREDRAQAVAELIQKANLPANYVERIAQSGMRTAAKVDELHINEIRTLLADLEANPPQTPAHDAVLTRLKKLGAADVPVIEGMLQVGNSTSSPIVLRNVLPQISPAHAALVELEDSDVQVRRHGASTLSQLGQASSLSPLVLRRLRELLIHEQDRWVWRAALVSVSADATDESAEVALLAVNHAWPDIRELGCQYVCQHGHPRMALWLLPLLDDSNKTVQLAAVNALGNCHNPLALDGLAEPGSGSRRRGLRELLSHQDKTLQFAVMVSMSRLGDPQGMQELVRMSYHQSAQIREEAVRQIGFTGQTQFVGHLINLAWTESHDTVRRSILESLERLVPSDKRPRGLAQEAGYDAKIRLWATWWQA